MSDSGKQSPLGVNVLGSLLQNLGFYINPKARSYMGENKSTDGEYTPGRVIYETSLKWLTYGINDAYVRGQANTIDPTSPTPSGPVPFTVNSTTYNNLINIGQSRIPALGNSPPPTWETSDPGNVWVNQHTDYIPPTLPRFSRTAQAGSPANSGYGFYAWNYPVYDDEYNRLASYQTEGQNASWYPFLATVEDPDNPSTYLTVPNRMITQWGWIRCMALQAWNEFNWNGETIDQLDNSPVGSPVYKNFVDTFSTCDGFVNYSNEAIYAVEDSQTFLKGTYSNQNDLISADISGVSLSSRAFGADLINLGNALDLKLISRFGLPSVLLQTLQNNNALTQPVILSLLTIGLSQNEITDIASGNVTPTKGQEQNIYGAFLPIVGDDLRTILITLNCRTKGINSLADLLSVKKLFPSSFTTLTVPVYNTNPGPTNSKTYYLLFVKQELNPQLVIPRIKQAVGVIVPPVEPPPPEPEPILPPIVPEIIAPIIGPVAPPEEPAPPIVIPEPLPEPIIFPQPPPPEPDIPIPPVVQPPPLPVPVAPPIPPAPRSGGGGGCVALESFVPLVEKDQKHNGREITKAWMLESGMKISLGTDDLQIVDGQVVKTLNDYQPCVRISTVDGITLVCSTTAPIYTKDQGFIPATEVYGKRVAVMRNGKTWFDEVVGLEDVGMKFVRVIDAGNNSFWAGERPGSFILHHNVPINDKLNMDKK